MTAEWAAAAGGPGRLEPKDPCPCRPLLVGLAPGAQGRDGWAGELLAPPPSPHRPHLMNTARVRHMEPSGPALGTTAYRALVVALGGEDKRFAPRRLERRLPETTRALRLRAGFLGIPRQPGEALKSPAWAKGYQKIFWTVLGVFIVSTTRWEGLAWPSRQPSHRLGRLTSRQKPTNTHDSPIS